MPQWRISKYDPLHRDREGRYLKDEWTDVSQLGSLFQGVLFDRARYLTTETTYIDVVLSFLCESGVSELVVKRLEAPSNPIDEEAYPWLAENSLLGPLPFVYHLHDDQVISLPELPVALQSILRGITWFTLECERSFYVEVGWDYYLYVGSAHSCSESVKTAQTMGLFVEVLAPGQYRARVNWPA